MNPDHSILAAGLKLSAERRSAATGEPMPSWATKPDVVTSWLEFFVTTQKVEPCPVTPASES